MAAQSTKEPSTAPVNRHAPTALELQRAHLEKLLKDPSKPVVLPQAPGEKSVRAPREMMKNVQGSSAGAGSGEFHVYKQNRRREYERIKIMEEQSEKEAAVRDFEERRAQRETESEAKTAKNRAKRQKRKERVKGAKVGGDQSSAKHTDGMEPALKKRKFDNQGAQIIFRRPGEEDETDDEGDEGSQQANIIVAEGQDAPVAEERTIVIVDDS